MVREIRTSSKELLSSAVRGLTSSSVKKVKLKIQAKNKALFPLFIFFFFPEQCMKLVTKFTYQTSVALLAVFKCRLDISVKISFNFQGDYLD